MKQSLGTTVMLNFIIVFIVVTFAFLSATLSYMKAYKVNSRMSTIIEKYEGYNNYSLEEINNLLKTIGYSPKKGVCPETQKYVKSSYGIDDYRMRTTSEIYSSTDELNNLGLTLHRNPYDYCIYKYQINDNYYRYGIITYIHINVPIINNFIKVHLYNETDKIYNFHVIY